MCTYKTFDSNRLIGGKITRLDDMPAAIDIISDGGDVINITFVGDVEGCGNHYIDNKIEHVSIMVDPGCVEVAFEFSERGNLSVLAIGEKAEMRMRGKNADVI